MFTSVASKTNPDSSPAGLLGLKPTDWKKTAEHMDKVFPVDNYVEKLAS